MRVVRAAAVAGVVALLALLVWDVTHGTRGGVAAKVDQGHAVGAPDLRLPRFGEPGTFDLAAYRGKVVVLNFWASWCVDCKLEAKTLHDAAAAWKKKGVVFVGVDTKDFTFAASQYMRRYGVDYPVVRDVNGSAGDTWGVTGYPETFFIGKDGRVMPPHVNGPIPAADLTSTLERLVS